MTAVPEASPATVPAANTGGGFWGGLIGFIEFFIARARDCFSWPVVLLLVMFLPTSPLASTFVVLPSLVSHASTLDIAGVKIAVASDHQIPAPSSIAGKIRALTSADLHLLMTSNVSLPTSIPLSRTHDMEAFAHLEKLNLIAEAHVDRSNPADPIELFSLSDDGRKTYDYFIDVLIDVLKLPE
jgi:hypothetical protein